MVGSPPLPPLVAALQKLLAGLSLEWQDLGVSVSFTPIGLFTEDG